LAGGEVEYEPVVRISGKTGAVGDELRLIERTGRQAAAE
jgi:hypothetical protein